MSCHVGLWSLLTGGLCSHCYCCTSRSLCTARITFVTKMHLPCPSSNEIISADWMNMDSPRHRIKICKNLSWIFRCSFVHYGYPSIPHSHYQSGGINCQEIKRGKTVILISVHLKMRQSCSLANYTLYSIQYTVYTYIYVTIYTI